MMVVSCFSSLGCPDLSVDEIGALAGRYALPFIELRAINGGVDVIEQLQKRFGAPDRAAAWLAEQKFRIAMLGTSFRLIGDQAGKDHLLEFAEWGEALDVPYLRVFDGGECGNEEELEEAGASIGWWRNERAKRGLNIDIAVETHDCLIEKQALSQFIARTDCPVLWDTHHTWRKGGMSVAEAFSIIGNRAVHLHVKDSKTTPDGFAYCLPGEGEFPMAELKSALKSGGYAGPISLEWEKLWHRDLPDLEQALDATKRNW